MSPSSSSYRSERLDPSKGLLKQRLEGDLAGMVKRGKVSKADARRLRVAMIHGTRSEQDSAIAEVEKKMDVRPTPPGTQPENRYRW